MSRVGKSMEPESRIEIARALGEGGVESESLPQLGFLLG